MYSAFAQGLRIRERLAFIHVVLTQGGVQWLKKKPSLKNSSIARVYNIRGGMCMMTDKCR